MANSGYQLFFTGSAGGDLSGTYPNPTVAKIRNRAVSNAAPSVGQTIVWDGAQWVPGDLPAKGVTFFPSDAYAVESIDTYNGILMDESTMAPTFLTYNPTVV